MYEAIKQFDLSVFFAINGAHSEAADWLMLTASNRVTWIPFYAVLLFFISKKIKGTGVFLLLLVVALLIATSDQLSVLLFKNTFQRLRPCHAYDLVSRIHLVGSCGGMYGFVSSHASNTVALSALLIASFNKDLPLLKYFLISWAFLVCYSRIYLGVHYPSDIFGGALFGLIAGLLFSKLFFYLNAKLSSAN